MGTDISASCRQLGWRIGLGWNDREANVEFLPDLIKTAEHDSYIFLKDSLHVARPLLIGDVPQSMCN